MPALESKIHREFWEKYGGKLPREEVSSRIYLVRERQARLFNKDQFDGFIAQFRGTIGFAKLTLSDTTQEDSDGCGSESTTKEVEQNEHKNHPELERKKPKRWRQMEAGMREDIFSLDDGEGTVIIQWPERLSPESASDVEDWLEIVARKIQRAVVCQRPKVEDDSAADEDE